MPDQETLGSFIREMKQSAQDYLDTRARIYKLRLIRTVSRLAGNFAWIFISIFLGFLLIIFLGMVTGFWLSELTGSFTKGFGLTALILFVLILLVTALRKVLFVNPLIRMIIRKTESSQEEEEEEKSINA